MNTLVDDERPGRDIEGAMFEALNMTLMVPVGSPHVCCGLVMQLRVDVGLDPVHIHVGADLSQRHPGHWKSGDLEVNFEKFDVEQRRGDRDQLAFLRDSISPRPEFVAFQIGLPLLAVRRLPKLGAAG